MKIIDVKQKTPEWLEARWGKVTGSEFSRILGTPKSADTYFYEVLAERLSVASADEEESDMARGTRLESEAIAAFEKKTGKKVDAVGFIQSDVDKNFGISPDGVIRRGKKIVEQPEVKCLSSKWHVKAWIENQVPPDHMPQVIAAFIANDDLKIVWFVMYDPRIAIKPLLIFKVERANFEENIEEAKAKLKAFLARVDSEVSKRVKI